MKKEEQIIKTALGNIYSLWKEEENMKKVGRGWGKIQQDQEVVRNSTYPTQVLDICDDSTLSVVTVIVDRPGVKADL